ncbi:hypothetical protein KEM54_004098, partial [Ascosphaera aggregata]
MGPNLSWNPSTDYTPQPEESESSESFIIEDITDSWTDKDKGHLILPYEYEEPIAEQTVASTPSLSLERRNMRLLPLESHDHIDPSSSLASSMQESLRVNGALDVSLAGLQAGKPTGKKRKANSSIEDAHNLVFSLTALPATSQDASYRRSPSLTDFITPKKRLIVVSNECRSQPRIKAHKSRNMPTCCFPAFSMHPFTGRHIPNGIPIGPID